MATLIERVQKALNDYTSGRDAMHVPPKDTDVDVVLSDVLQLLGMCSFSEQVENEVEEVYQAMIQPRRKNEKPKSASM